jgi:hypothetical protein
MCEELSIGGSILAFEKRRRAKKRALLEAIQNIRSRSWEVRLIVHLCVLSCGWDSIPPLLGAILL